MRNEMIAFIGGTIIGASVAYYITAKIKDQEKEEEIASIKKEFSKRKSTNKENKKKKDWEKIKEDVKPKNARGEDSEKHYRAEKDDILKYTKTINDSGYIPPNSPIRPSENDMNSIEIISPDVFGDEDDYEEITLTYYHENDILTDENDTPIENRELIVGDFENHFGEYDNDCVCVMNRKLKIYYEITLDETDYYSHPRPSRIEVTED